MPLRLFAFAFLLALVFAGPLSAQNSSQQERTQTETTTQTVTTGDPAEDFALAQEYDSDGNAGQAIAAYRAFIKRHPASPFASKAQFRIAELLEASGNASKAFDAYQTLVTRYPDTPEFEKAVSQQVLIANQFLEGKRISVFGLALLPGVERAETMYKAILKNAPYSKNSAIAQFNLGLSYERQGKVNEARQAFQTVLDKYPNHDVADDALYQIGYVYMRTGMSGQSQDLSSLILAKETFEDFLLQYPRSEKIAQARDNLVTIGGRESGDLLLIAKYYDWSKDYKAAMIYYNDIIRRQPKSESAEFAKSRIEVMRSELGEDALRVGSERAETGEKLALRRRLQAQVETSSLSNYSGPPKRDFAPDELPIVKSPKLRTNSRDVQPLPAVEPALPTQ